MTRARLALIAGIAVIVAACALPCATFAELSAVSLPYQDPTPEMLVDQAAEVAALERVLVIHLSIAVGMMLLGALACVYGLRRRHHHRAGHNRAAVGDPPGDA